MDGCECREMSDRHYTLGYRDKYRMILKREPMEGAAISAIQGGRIMLL